MISRKYIEYKLANNKKDIGIVCDCQNSETLNSFLVSDVKVFEDWIKKDFDEVLSGKVSFKEISGNVCYVEINSQKTKIYDTLIDDDEEYNATCCEVDTKELRELIDEWSEKVKEFKRNNK